MFNKSCQWLDLNQGRVVSNVTPLPQPLSWLSWWLNSGTYCCCCITNGHQIDWYLCNQSDQIVNQDLSKIAQMFDTFGYFENPFWINSMWLVFGQLSGKIWQLVFIKYGHAERNSCNRKVDVWCELTKR